MRQTSTTYDVVAPSSDETMLPLADYATRAGKTLRTVQRWLEAGELPGAQQDGDGKWWVPASARRVAAPAMEKRVRKQAAKVTPSSYDVAPVSPAPGVSPLGALGSLEEAAAALGTSTGGVERLYADMVANPGLPLYVGRYGRFAKRMVYAPPR